MLIFAQLFNVVHIVKVGSLYSYIPTVIMKLFVSFEWS